MAAAVLPLLPAESGSQATALDPCAGLTQVDGLLAGTVFMSQSDVRRVRELLEYYQSGMERYLAMTGVDARHLRVQP